jgi:leader peptidase (prepilin peptidase)/N-methyltransferase
VIPEWFWYIFLFIIGCCIGSFLNVVIYRLPRNKSLIKPGSFCPACGKHINWFDNIPLISWIVLTGKCRECKSPVSPRYFIIELLTGLVLSGLFILFFILGIRRFEINGQTGPEAFIYGGWFIYLIYIILLAAFIAASAIDLKFWIIPISVCWFVTLVGLAGSAIAVYIINPDTIRYYHLLPYASADTGSLAVGAVIGMIISYALLRAGIIKRSYENEQILSSKQEEIIGQIQSEKNSEKDDSEEINHRIEVCKEIFFLLPIIIASITALAVSRTPPVSSAWRIFSQHPVIAGFLGSLWGYFIGCAVVWLTRITGTLAFGKEAMGLGDVHLMGAAGSVIGPFMVVVAFFIAPFFGLFWVSMQMFFKKIRQIPYGPFLSLGIFTVMILYDWIFEYLIFMFY